MTTDTSAHRDDVDRILSAAEEESAPITVFRGTSGQSLSPLSGVTRGDMDLEERQALRRVASLSTELDDVTEVEYRQLRLEKVVLIGVYNQGTVIDAENSLRELAH